MISRTRTNLSNRHPSATILTALAIPLLLAVALGFPEGAVADDLVISGTVTYAGSQGPVSAAKPILLFVTRSRVLDGIPVALGRVETSGGAFALTVPEPGDYYLAYLLDTNGTAVPDLGDPFGIYNNRLKAPGDPITVPVSGEQSNLTLVFDDSAELSGVHGTVTYTGSMGPVSDTRPIQVQVFREGDLTDRVDREQRLVTNGGSYSFLLLESRLFYMEVFLDLNDNGVLDSGEPFQIYPDRYAPPGDPLPQGIAEVDISFGDGPPPTPTAPPDLVVSGTIEYTGARGPVSESRPIYVVLFDNPMLDGAPVAGGPVSENGGSFEIGAPGPGDYYLAYLLVTNGEGPTVGDPFEIYQDHFTTPADAITVPQTGLVLSFDDSAGLPGVLGTVTYTGSQGPVSNDKPIIVDAFRDAALTDRLDQSQDLKNNGDSYQFILFENTPHYMQAFLDLNHNGNRDPGEPLTIYNGKTSPPGDPVPEDGSMVDLSFGDLPNTPTPTSQTATPTVTPTLPAIACVGDCNSDGTVTIDDILLGINIALGSVDVTQCSAFDLDGSGTVTIDEVLAGVNSALNGCPKPPGCDLPFPFCGGDFPLNTEMTTQYGPAWADVVLQPSNFVPCFGPYALCYYANCTVTPDGKASACPCYEWFGPNFVLDTSILNADSYQATSETCPGGSTSCSLPNSAPVCQDINRGTFAAGASRISTFGFYRAASEPIGSTDCTNMPGPYAGCMTGLCAGPTVSNPDGSTTIGCDCPIFDGPFQIGKSGLSCNDAPMAWSAAYNTTVPPNPCDMVAAGACIPDAPTGECGCPLYSSSTMLPPDSGVDCAKVCNTYTTCVRQSSDTQLGFTCDATLCTSSKHDLVFDACLGLQDCDLSEVFKAETAAGCSCCASQLCNCAANADTEHAVFTLDAAQRQQGETPQCDINGTLCGTPP